jgi:hypothetical protein
MLLYVNCICTYLGGVSAREVVCTAGLHASAISSTAAEIEILSSLS